MSVTRKRVAGFELGCNYWPRSSAMYMWQDLDLGEIREDFAHLYDLGFRVVRFFLLTQDFMPAPKYVPRPKLDALVEGSPQCSAHLYVRSPRGGSRSGRICRR